MMTLSPIVRRLLPILPLLGGAPATAQVAVKPLFAQEAPLPIVVRGPVRQIERTAEKSTSPLPAVLEVEGASLPIRLSARGISRRTKAVCTFPPLRVAFDQSPATGTFAGQKRLKLVTHCREASSFDQYVLLEYAAYRLYNLLSPVSHRARLVSATYLDDRGKPRQRTGFFIEDLDDVARRNGLGKAHRPSRIAASELSSADAARVALFQYMIGNLDWSMRAGPAGEECCHNGQLLGGPGRAGLVPVPYDFDHSGLVNAPYARPPEGLGARTVRQRVWRGYCSDNADVRRQAAAMVQRRAQFDAALSTIPGLEPRTLGQARAFLDGFYATVGDPTALEKLLKDCLPG